MLLVVQVNNGDIQMYNVAGRNFSTVLYVSVNAIKGINYRRLYGFKSNIY